MTYPFNCDYFKNTLYDEILYVNHYRYIDNTYKINHEKYKDKNGNFIKFNLKPILKSKMYAYGIRINLMHSNLLILDMDDMVLEYSNIEKINEDLLKTICNIKKYLMVQSSNLKYHFYYFLDDYYNLLDIYYKLLGENIFCNDFISMALSKKYLNIRVSKKFNVNSNINTNPQIIKYGILQ